MKILVTGGTVFVSKFMAEYLLRNGHDVYVLNRNTRPQPHGAKLIDADRNDLHGRLSGMFFDAVIDVTAYTGKDVSNLLDALDGFGSYVLISSSAVYPDTAKQPFTETTERGANRFWGDYGLNKIAAEDVLKARVPGAYILRPPYIYGEYNNVYREAWVFNCAANDRPFYIPGDGSMKLQFIHVEDVCRFAEMLITVKPTQTVFNVGGQTTSALEWVKACYAATGKRPTVINVERSIEQRRYFPFHAYSYELDCTEQYKLCPDVIGLENGIKRAYAQYLKNDYVINRKDYQKFIAENLKTHE